MARDERVVPKGVETDARPKAERGEHRRKDTGLVLGAEREKIVNEHGDAGAFGSGDGPTNRPPEQVLAHEVGRREQDSRHPDQDIAGRRGRVAPVVVGLLALVVGFVGSLLGALLGRLLFCRLLFGRLLSRLLFGRLLFCRLLLRSSRLAGASTLASGPALGERFVSSEFDSTTTEPAWHPVFRAYQQGACRR